MVALVVGGTSGLGLELAKLLKSDYDVAITGRQNPQVKGLAFTRIELGTSVQNISRNIEDLCFGGEPLDLVVYAAGYFQEGTIGELAVKDIVLMNNVGFLAPAILINRV